MDTIATPVGDARVHVAAATTPRGTLVLGHGAGGGIEAADLVVLAEALPGSAITVVRVEQPWRVAGKRVAGPPATLDRAWVAVLGALALPGPVVVGGRSAGARVACRTARQVGAVGVVALAFPLHPPGRPERTRLSELEECGVPALVVQGSGTRSAARRRFRGHAPCTTCAPSRVRTTRSGSPGGTTERRRSRRWPGPSGTGCSAFSADRESCGPGTG